MPKMPKNGCEHFSKIYLSRLTSLSFLVFSCTLTYKGFAPSKVNGLKRHINDSKISILKWLKPLIFFIVTNLAILEK